MELIINIKAWLVWGAVGVPARLAEARARRNAEKQEPIVTLTETVEANRR